MFSRFKPFEGPARFVWKDPDTGTEFVASSKAELVDRIVVYRSQNNLEFIEHLPQVLENYWCGLEPNKHKCIPVDLQRGFLGYLKGGVALIQNMVYQSFVPQEVADKRAGQCVTCKFNVWPDKGAFVAWSDKIAEASTLGRKSKHHDDLASCEACGCPLKAKVFYGGTIPLEEEWLPKMQEAACWQIPSGKVIKK